MKTEENVYEKELKTEEQGAVSASGGDHKDADEALAVLGKFKDVNALARAYGALQAEFTRRSQRLKVLEKEAEKSEDLGDGAPRSGAEKLRKNAQARREENKKFDEFLASATSVGEKDLTQNQDPAADTTQTSNGDALEQISENGATIYEMNAVKDEPTNQGEVVKTEREKGTPQAGIEEQGFSPNAQAALKGGNAFSSVAGSEDATDPSALLYAKVCQDEQVRLRIIGEYLSSIGRAGAPIMTSGVGTLAPPLRAKSISEAGDMALRFFKKPAAEA